MLKTQERVTLLKRFDKYQWQETGWLLSNGGTINIVHNIVGDGNINSANAAFQSWLTREDPRHLTSDRFCQYINSKRQKGLADYWAMLKAEFDSLKRDFNTNEQ